MEETFSDAEEPLETVSASMLDVQSGFRGAQNPFSDAEADDYALEDEDEMPKFDPKPSNEAKIRELLRNISSIEIKLCADGSKEFMKLLRGSYGGEFLYEYVRSSSKFTELMEAWNRWRGKPGLSYVLSLLSVILGHPEGKYRPNDPDRVSISRVLDKFSRSIVEEKLDDIYKELNSKEGKRQKAALLLLGSIVRRGSLLAAEVAKSFDFKLSILPKLSEYKRKPVERRKKHSTRGAFVEFAMSFLEVGKPGLLRWVIQQREIFSGILRGLGNDDDETVVYVLSTLRDRVLTPESLIPPSLRSVLFGSVTLEQLVGISAREDGGLAAKAAYEVLVMVCTDPSNGLMPDLKRQLRPLKGNPKRLLDLMKKLRATEIGYHRDLLLAIVSGRPSLGSSYLDEFPFNLEDNASPTWLSVVTLAANVIRSVRIGISWDFLVCHTDRQLTFESSEVQSVFKCVCPRPVSRIVINRGLLHPDPLMKHATLRLLLEVLKFLSSFIDALSMNRLYPLKHKIQDEVRILLPDPQVLFKLLSSFFRTYRSSRSSLKRAADPENICQSRSAAVKKLKVDFADEDIDILVGGLNSGTENIVLGETVKPGEAVTASQFNGENDDERLMDIWGSDDSFSSDVVKDAEVYFHCNVLKALKIFHGPLHAVSEVSYDVFRLLPSNPLEFPSILLHSLLSMLIEDFGCSQDFSPTMLRPIYKRLQYFLNLSIQSSMRSIKEQAFVLAKAAMRSTGAFDKNPWEIGAWLLFLPVCVADDSCSKYEEGEFFQSLSTPLVSFLYDAVSSVGNKLVDYWALLRCRLSNLEVVKDQKVNVSPLIICVMEKCLRLLSAESEALTLPVKSMISLYVCNTLKYLLQTQVEAETLAAVVHKFLSERIVDCTCDVADGPSTSCEWRPLVHLLRFSQSIIQQETCLFNRVCMDTNTSFFNTIAEVKSLLNADSTKVFAISKALYSTLICIAADDVLENLPLVMHILGGLPGFHHYFMNYFYHDQSIMNHLSKLWPQIFSSGLGMSVIASAQLRQDIDNQTSVKLQCTDFESLQHGAFVFGSCLREAPFHILFPAVIFCGCEYYSKIKELLITKLSNLTAEQIGPSLRLVLFWFHQMLLTYRKKPSEQLEFFFEICSILVECILAQLSALKRDSRSSATGGIPLSLCIQEVSATVLCHPAVFAALSCPSAHGYKPNEILLTDNSDVLLNYCVERVCKPALHVLNLLPTTCDYLVALCAGENSLSLYPKCRENILKNFRHLIQRIILIFKEGFSLWCSSRDVTFFPVLYAILALKRYISPIEILELANWMLAGKKISNSMLLQASSSSPVCLGFSVASAAFDTLAEYLQPLNMQPTPSDFFCAIEKRSLDAALFESIYFKAFQFATNLKLDLADVCLVKSLNTARSLTYRQDLLPPSMEIMRVIASTPVKLLSHCIYRTNSTKAKLLFLLTEISPLHLSVFGCLFLNILRKDVLQKVDAAAGTNDQSFSDQDYLILMPAAFSYLSSTRTVLGEQSFSNVECMLSFYSEILLDGFRNWKYFVSSSAFQVESGHIMPSSVENLQDLFQSSLLGKAVNLVQWHLAVTADNMSKRLRLFCSICPSSDALDEFLDVDVSDVDSYSVGQLLNFITRVIAKISLSLVLLFPENNQKGLANKAQDKEEVESIVGLNDEDSLRERFLEMMVSVWKWVVQKLPLACANSAQQGTKFLLFRSLEVFTLRCISRLTMEMHNHLIQMDSLPFLKKMAEVSLRHRFGDSTTLQTLRCILSSLSDGKLPVVWLFQRLLAHSQLAPTIGTLIESSNCTPAGMVAKPISSFLRSLIVHSTNCKSEKCEKHKEQLEVIKLLRLLFDLRAQQGSISEDELGVNWRGLLSLFLPPYGATMSEIDLELYSILSQIESARGMDHSIIADLDYLWGSAALRKIKEHGIKHVLLDDNMADAEEDCRRSQFRDNLPIDLKLLIRTILYFPYERNVCGKSLIFNSSYEDNIQCTAEEYLAEFGRVACYDPVFVLSFSIYSLSMGYLDPVEFAGVGLLAMALVSMASPEDGVRKLGYEVLGRLKDALDGSQKKREATRLKNLLTYFQNAIEEPWQKIPSVAAVFIAEASVVLLDPSHDHYATISKIVEKASQTKLSKIYLESIPLFQDMLWSTSMNFGTDRMWVLHLLYAGINAEDDGRIFIRNAVPEILLSIYTSPLSNNEEKGLILQVLKKCVKVQNVACYLIEKCCLLSWLSKALSLSLGFADGQDIFSCNQLVLLLEVVNEVFSSKSTMEWLEKYALEQLSDLSCNLFDLLVRYSKLAHETLPLVVLVLKIIISALEISQNRKMYQPHFTLSMWSLYQLYQAVHRCDNVKSSLCAELGLKVILMSIPPATILEMGQQEISQFLIWAVATAIQSDSKRMLQPAEFASHVKLFTEEHSRDDSLMPSLLRWLVASVILWRVSCSRDPDYSFGPREANRETLLSLMEKSENRGRGTELVSGSKEVLAVTIYHLQQLIGVKCRVLPSVVAALSILLLSDGSYSAGSGTTVNCENPLPLLWSNIRYPPEAKPAWRWSFYKPSTDVLTECTDLEKMDEPHACQKVLVIILGKLRKRSADCQLLSLEELDSLGLFKWGELILYKNKMFL